MTHHPDDGRIQAHIDGELEFDEAEALERHLEHCAPCREARELLVRRGRELSEALALLDRPADPEAFLWEIHRRRSRERSRRQSRHLAAAAVLVLFVGAGAAFAFPGSPVRDWLAGTPDAPPALTTLSEEAVTLRIEPVEGRLRLELEGEVAGTGVLARVGEEEQLVVAAPAGARFEHGAGWLRVTAESGGGTLRLSLPPGMQELRLETPRGARTLRALGDELRIEGEGAPEVAAPGAGGWVVLFGPVRDEWGGDP